MEEVAIGKDLARRPILTVSSPFEGVCQGSGSATLSVFSYSLLESVCEPLSSPGVEVSVSAGLLAAIKIQCGASEQPQEVHVSTVQLEDEEPRPDSDLVLMASEGLSSKSDELGLDPQVGIRIPLASLSRDRRWTAELAAAWGTFELSAPGLEMPSSVEGDLFTVDLNLVYRSPVGDRSRWLVAGGVGWSFAEADLGEAALSSLATGIEDGDLAPSLAVGFEWDWASRSTLDARYVWRPLATSPLDDGASSAVQVGLGFRLR